jgi:hypothetical protein
MSSRAPNDLVSIATHIQKCLVGFSNVCTSLVKADSYTRGKIPSGTIEDCLGNYWLWVGETGASRRRHGSLDYKLREAPDTRDTVIQLLQGLETVLKEAVKVTSGRRVPWEDLFDSNSDSDGSEEDSERPDEERTTELAQLSSNMAETNECLMRLYRSWQDATPP